MTKTNPCRQRLATAIEALRDYRERLTSEADALREWEDPESAAAVADTTHQIAKVQEVIEFLTDCIRGGKYA